MTAAGTAGPFGSQCPTTSAMTLLRSGVPLSLLLDLAWGPCSEELMAVERPAGPAGSRTA